MQIELNKLYIGDSATVLKTFPDEIVQTCITSPPYFQQRDYEIEGQIGHEKTPEEYIERLMEVFREVRRVLKPDGTLWLNLGDGYWSERHSACDTTFHRTGREFLYNGSIKRGKHPVLKPKDLIGVPWRTAFALQEDGWYLRQCIIWHKPVVAPESVTDRCCGSYEFMFLLAKSERYYFDTEAIKEPVADGFSAKMRIKRSVWTARTSSEIKENYAAFPKEIITPCILAGSKKGDIVLDPFMGTGTVARTSKELRRDYLGIDLNPTYTKNAENRLACTFQYKSIDDI